MEVIKKKKKLTLAIVTMTAFLVGCGEPSNDQSDIHEIKQDSISHKTIESTPTTDSDQPTTSSTIPNKIVGKQLRTLADFTKPNDYIKEHRFSFLDSTNLDIDNDGIDDNISFYILDSLKIQDGEVVSDSDPKDFSYVVLNLSEMDRSDTFLISDGVRPYFTNRIKANITKFNILGYGQLLQHPKSNLLIFEGYVYGDGTGSQIIINITDGYPRVILNDDQRIESAYDVDGKLIITLLEKKNDKYAKRTNYVLDNYLFKTDLVPFHQVSIPYDQVYDAGQIPAIFIFPDSSEIDSLQHLLGNDFMTAADDYSYYDFEAQEFLKSSGIRFASTDKRYLRFVMYRLKQKDTIYIDTDTLTSAWGLVLFDGYDPPIISSSIDVHQDFKELDE